LHALSHISNPMPHVALLKLYFQLIFKLVLNLNFHVVASNTNNQSFQSSNNIKSLLLVENRFDARGDVEHAKPSFVVVLPL